MSVQQFNNIAISSENVTEYRSLRPGDQLAVQGEMEGIDYYHHGIFISAEVGLIDFGGPNKREATVRSVDLLKFTDFGRKRLVRITYPKGQCLPPEVVVDNAKKLLKNPHRWGAFDIITNNCEHFATKCKTGIAISKQVIVKIRECILNPFQVFTYAVASSGGLGSSGSFGSRH